MCQTFESADGVIQFYAELASPFYEENHEFGNGIGDFISAHGELVSDYGKLWKILYST